MKYEILISDDDNDDDKNDEAYHTVKDEAVTIKLDSGIFK